MKKASVVIVGGGLSGLYAAYLLEKRGIQDYVVFEAQERLGGRLLSVHAGEARFDLGATWYWPETQPMLDVVVEELGLQKFHQYEAGKYLLEHTVTALARRFNGLYSESPQSLRIVGGMASLIDALAARVPSSKVLREHRVCLIDHTGESTVLIEAQGQNGTLHRVTAKHVLLAVPPRLAVDSIEFQPALPRQLERDWADCPTWMAPHAKYVAVYDRPFWREQGLSGNGRSYAGPMVEIHDASPREGAGAVFGFIGLPALTRQKMPTDVLLNQCRAQLGRLFGADALTPKQDWLKDWSQDGFIATSSDVSGTGEHATAPTATAKTGAWAGRITGIASEWSPEFPGYVAGAIDAVARALRHVNLERIAR